MIPETDNEEELKAIFLECLEDDKASLMFWVSNFVDRLIGQRAARTELWERRAVLTMVGHSWDEIT